MGGRERVMGRGGEEGDMGGYVEGDMGVEERGRERWGRRREEEEMGRRRERERWGRAEREKFEI